MSASRIQTDVFVVPLLDRYLVYAPLRQVALLTNAATVNLLDRARQAGVEPGNEQERAFLQLCEEICLTGTRGDVPINTLGDGDPQPTEVTLFLTTRCSLRCIYCYASAGDRPLQEMSLATAQRGIEYACHNAAALGESSFCVGYHGGGEPSAHWGVLTTSFDYARQLARAHGMRVDGSMATNGVLNPEQRRWVIQNLSSLSVSMDGLPLVQDRQRPLASGGASSPTVLQTLADLTAADFPFGIRITVTAASVEHLPAGIEYLLEHTRPRDIQIEPVYELGRGRGTGLGVNPTAFVDAFRQAQAVATERWVRVFYSAARLDVLTNRFCRSCGEGFNITPQGLVSACYEVPQAASGRDGRYILGAYDADQARFVLDPQRLARLRRDTVESIAWCRDCFCRWHCAGDCAHKTRTGATAEPFVPTNRCQITRSLTLDQILSRIRDNGGSLWAARLSKPARTVDRENRGENRGELTRTPNGVTFSIRGCLPRSRKKVACGGVMEKRFSMAACR